MCGIAGFISNSDFDRNKYIKDLVKSIAHRGPDEYGVYDKKNICLLNTRLSIIDVEHGHQPFFSDDENIIVIQNGEVYNFIEIQKELENRGVRFETKSDTEVILRAYEYYGVRCFKKFNGMFAIAIYDKNINKLLLARDRLGVKPLYIYQKENELHFSSEIKSFLCFTFFDKSINQQSIHNYLKFNYIPIPETIYKYVKHIEPATYCEIDINTLQIEKKYYWEIENIKENKTISEDEILEKIDTILKDAIKIRLRSDVKIGAFLSGGLDSSLVCAMTKKIFNKSLDSYSIGFEEKRFDESIFAREVAAYCDINNNIHILKSDIVDLWSTTTWYSDQPHGDISFIPTYILSEFAAKDYKLVFTGDGADEAFAGYTKYFSILKSSMKDYFDFISLIKDDRDFDKLYDDDFKKSVDYTVPFQIFNSVINEVDVKDNINKILYFDTKQLLPGNNLVKPDKMAMANSLETRSPLLDYRIFELIQSIPGKYKLQAKETKYILKKFALKYLPYNIVYREKQMFTVPVGEWFKENLKDYVVEIITSKSLNSRGIFNGEYLEKILYAHIDGKKDYTRELRAIVNLELWFRKFYD